MTNFYIVRAEIPLGHTVARAAYTFATMEDVESFQAELRRIGGHIYKLQKDRFNDPSQAIAQINSYVGKRTAKTLKAS